jgi:hypothetical protein
MTLKTFYCLFLHIAYNFMLFMLNGGLKASRVNGNIIGTVASGVGTTTNLPTQTMLPQFLYFEIATVPQSIKVNVNGDSLLVDLDTAGISALSNIRSNGKPTSGFLIQVANGLLTGVNVDITVVNNVATAFTVFGLNRRYVPVDAPGLMQSLGITLNASQAFDVENFFYAAFPSMTANDTLNIYGNRFNLNGAATGREWSAKEELEPIRGGLQLYENQTASAKIAFDNYDRDITRINFIPNAAQKIYFQRLIPAGERIGA